MQYNLKVFHKPTQLVLHFSIFGDIIVLGSQRMPVRWFEKTIAESISVEGSIVDALTIVGQSLLNAEKEDVVC
jgi:hypothetical protein